MADMRQKAINDRNSEMTVAREDGLTIGKEEGKQEGIAIGKEEGKKEGIAIGKEEGKQEGIAIGEAKGIAEGKKETAIAMLAKGLDIGLVADCTGLSVEDINALTYG
jgi:predicted transposase YdaD